MKKTLLILVLFVLCIFSFFFLCFLFVILFQAILAFYLGKSLKNQHVQLPNAAVSILPRWRITRFLSPHSLLVFPLYGLTKHLCFSWVLGPSSLPYLCLFAFSLSCLFVSSSSPLLYLPAPFLLLPRTQKTVYLVIVYEEPDFVYVDCLCCAI